MEPTLSRATRPEWTPHPLRQDEMLYFLHIPKTAGTSLRAYLEDQFDPGATCPSWVMNELLDAPPSRLSAYRLIAGHYGAYLYPMLTRDPVTITMLRDPIERSISHFADLRARPGQWLYERCSQMTIDEFVADPLGRAELTNFQVRYLAQDDLGDGYFGHSELLNRDPEAACARYKDGQLLEDARRRLRGMAFFGLAERFEDSMRLLATTFGWRPAEEMPRRNVGTGKAPRQELAPGTLAALEDATALDRALYEEAAGVFAERARGLTAQDAMEAYERTASESVRVESVSLGFDKAINGTGWLPREAQPGGTVCRWTGSEASLDFPLERRRDLEVQFRAGVYAQELLETVRLTANGQDVPLRVRHSHPRARSEGVFTGVIRPVAAPARPAYTRLKFSVARAVTPSREIPGDTDTRQLGMYFHWLEIFPRERAGGQERRCRAFPATPPDSLDSR